MFSICLLGIFSKCYHQVIYEKKANLDLSIEILDHTSVYEYAILVFMYKGTSIQLNLSLLHQQLNL